MLKNITLSAEETLIKKARARAAQEHISLNGIFQQWLSGYALGRERSRGYVEIMKQLRYVHAGKVFSRDERNAR